MNSQTSESHKANPIAELITSALYVVCIIIASTLIPTAASSSEGFNDIATLLGIFVILLMELTSLPFLYRAYHQPNRASWFRKYILTLPVIVLIISSYNLILLTATIQLWLLVVIIELLPLVMILKFRK